MKNSNAEQPTLPGMGEVISPKERKRTEYINKLTHSGFIDQNRIYLMNYINGDLSIALSHIKDAYTKYVIDNNWPEEKFTTVMNAIINKTYMLTSANFMRMGIKYDKGTLNNRYEWNHKVDTTEDKNNEIFDSEMDAIFEKINKKNKQFTEKE